MRKFKQQGNSVVDSWCITEDSFDAKRAAHNESVFSIGNGSLGFRGDFEEGAGDGNGVEGVYLNGFYETAPIHYGEVAYGYAKNAQTMLNLANPKRIRLEVDGEVFGMGQGEVEDYSRMLCLRSGLLKRTVLWRANGGGRVRLEISRFVSLAAGDVAFIHYKVTPLEGCNKLRLTSEIDWNTRNLAKSDDPRVGSGLGGSALETVCAKAEDETCLLVQQTKESGLAYACAVGHKYSSASGAVRNVLQREQAVGHVFEWEAHAGETVCLTKVIGFAHGKAEENGVLGSSAEKLVASKLEQGMEVAFEAHTTVMNEFWNRVGLSIVGDDKLLQGLRFNLFHLFQAVGRDGKTNIAAKGLTGEGYEGHYFWDTETYVFPFFLHTMPQIARSLLMYRYSTLDAARRRARELAHPRGALYAWRTIGGDECSAYYPAGTAQYHINADIANAVDSYVQVSGDDEFMRDYGLEILIETARLWLDLGFYNPNRGNAFCIYGVTGPDEYSVLVNDNCYTNLMARHNLQAAANWAQQVNRRWPEKARELFARLDWSANEAAEWEKAAEAMYVPYNVELGIYEQDDAFIRRKPWLIEEIPEDKFPLLLNYHPLVIYRHKVCKQADLVLALFLRGEEFNKQEKKACFDYYEPLTTHDSSLSKAVFGIIASEVGYAEKAYEYFESTARLDLEDRHSNTRDGLHMANMAGTWMGIAYGFAGMRIVKGRLSFTPRLPKVWERYCIRIYYRGSVIELVVSRGVTAYSLLEGEPLEIYNNGNPVLLEQSARGSVRNTG